MPTIDGCGSLDEVRVRRMDLDDEEIPEFPSQTTTRFGVNRQGGDQVRAVLDARRMAARRDGSASVRIDRERERLLAGFVLVAVVREFLIRVQVSIFVLTVVIGSP